jgi:excisionase family DNA binding protein
MNASKKPSNTPVFTGLKDLAEVVGVNYRTIHRAVKKGTIKTVRCGSLLKVPQKEVERILTKGF